MIELTQTVQKGGCAAKVAASELRKILGRVRFPPLHDSVLIDGGLFDDAAIQKVSEDLALVHTLDFFTPIVNTPRVFGMIAAANALSDVYAMGGDPKTAMAILAFPLSTMDTSVAVEVLQGASDVMAEGGVSLVGGHSIDDDTLKFGLSVTGFVHPQKVWSNSRAHEGDVLILTKPLGTGTLTAALKRKEIDESQMSDVIASMVQLNRVLPLLSKESSQAIHSATDVTGFGLAGHALNMAKSSIVTLRIHFKTLPHFSLAPECLRKGFLTKAHRTNAEYCHDFISPSAEVATSDIKSLLYDPQTSGGLFLSVDAKHAEQILSEIRGQFPHAKIVGEVLAKQSHHLEVL